MPFVEAAPKIRRLAISRERACQRTPEERAGGPRTQGEPPRQTTSTTHDDRFVSEALVGTAPKGRRIPAQGETLGNREVHAGVLKERRIGSGEARVFQSRSDLPDETADCVAGGSVADNAGECRRAD
jgi:hypothetical protein